MNLSKDTSLEYLKALSDDQFRESKLIHKVFLLFAAVFVLFSIVDWFYAQERFLEFLIIRISYTIIPILIFLKIEKTINFRQTEYLAFIHASAAAGVIQYMIFSTSGAMSPYYAGLNLVAIIALCFFTFSRMFFWLTATAIYLPYFILSTYELNFELKSIFGNFLINSFFLLGTLGVCALVHHFREYYRSQAVLSKFELTLELKNRSDEVRKKTEEAVNLSRLSSQFSPQIVESIRSGKIDLEKGSQRSAVCAIFIDIVNSTERVTRIDKDKVEKVLSKFLDDSIKIMLKYDITIDKFLGDGILAFCNAPVKREDYVSRIIRAAIEIKAKIDEDSEFYEKNWMKKLDIRIGIAKGFANVGFYGSKKYFKSYTAIGPVINLASRLCGAAKPGQILIDYDVYDNVQNEFEMIYSSKLSLKGFEDDVIYSYEVINSKSQIVNANLDANECETCGSILSLETNSKGQFEFICKKCSFEAAVKNAA